MHVTQAHELQARPQPIRAETTVGIAHGTRMAVRTRPWPRNFWFISSASQKPEATRVALAVRVGAGTDATASTLTATTSTEKQTHSVAHSQWNWSTMAPIVRAPTWIVVNHIATPVSAPSTKLTSTRILK